MYSNVHVQTAVDAFIDRYNVSVTQKLIGETKYHILTDLVNGKKLKFAIIYWAHTLIAYSLSFPSNQDAYFFKQDNSG